MFASVGLGFSKRQNEPNSSKSNICPVKLGWKSVSSAVGEHIKDKIQGT